jgi:protoheme IX farnesyltransferase
MKVYLELSKSGIVTLVLISVLGGYLIGHRFESPLSWGGLLLTLVGVMLLASGSSALNQLQEVKTDAKMPRTAKRPLPSGRMSKSTALAFIVGTLLGGLALLSKINASVCWMGVAAVIFYNGFYTMWWKRKWAFAAIPGAVPGALPIWMGYTAASGKVGAPPGIFLFLLLFFWQMPHFWVLALKYRDDYKQGAIPTLPVARGEGVTVQQILLWCFGYVALSLTAPIFLKVGALYLAFAIPMGLKLFWELRKFVQKPASKQWLHFFLWVNFSLIIYIGAAVADFWSTWLLPLFI